jgi:hypothetical protein
MTALDGHSMAFAGRRAARAFESLAELLISGEYRNLNLPGGRAIYHQPMGSNYHWFAAPQRYFFNSGKTMAGWVLMRSEDGLALHYKWAAKS